MTLSPDEIRAHWQNWARTYGTSLRATSKSTTGKRLEIDALRRALARIRSAFGRPIRVLEAGCGNGHNVLALAESFPDDSFAGFDYIPEMVTDAQAQQAGLREPRITFFQDDVLALDHAGKDWDVVFTVRCLINLTTSDLQTRAISVLSERLSPGGWLLMVENSRQTYDRQNRARELVGLVPRSPAPFNHFFDDDVVLRHLAHLGMTDVSVEDFISLHDLVLYVIVPMLSGDVDYDHPLVEAAARLNQAISSEFSSGLGSFGQNRLYVARRPEREP
jgi:SAM-dependent methyltransferase